MAKLKKPAIKLNPLEKTAVELPTRKIGIEVMRVFESGKWKWNFGELPTKHSIWDQYKENTCVTAGVDYSSSKEGNFGYADKEFYENNGWKTISVKEFYELQPDVNPEVKEKINAYFDSLNSQNQIIF